MRFSRSRRLTRRREFLAVQEKGRKLAGGELLVLALPNEVGHARLGVTVSTKVGNAVARNRVKRRVREAFRAVAASFPAVDLVVIARAGAPGLEFGAVEKAFAAAKDRLTR